MLFVFAIGRLLLCMLFLSAGIPKLRNIVHFKETVRAFGVPRWAVSIVAVLLPVVEISIGISLLSSRFVHMALAAGAVLLSAFGLIMLFHLSKGSKPVCMCFGNAAVAPINWTSPIRTVALAAISAGLLFLGSGLNTMPYIGEMACDMLSCRVPHFAATLDFLVIIIVICFLLTGAGSQSRMSRAKDKSVRKGHNALFGATLDPFELWSLEGNKVSIDTLLSNGQSALLLFLEPRCFQCKAVIDSLSKRTESTHARAVFVIVANRALDLQELPDLGRLQILIQEENEVAAKLGVVRGPSAILIRPARLVASHLAEGYQEIMVLAELADRTNGLILPNTWNDALRIAKAPTQSFSKGQLLPELEASDHAGKPILVKSLVGRPLVLLFWDQKSEHCAIIAEKMKHWESTLKPADVILVIISASLSDSLSNEFSGLRLVENKLSIRRTLGVQGVPAAILINSQGSFASDIALGSPAIFSILGI